MKAAKGDGKEYRLKEATAILQGSERTVQGLKKDGCGPYRGDGRWLRADRLKHRQDRRGLREVRPQAAPQPA